MRSTQSGEILINHIALSTIFGELDSSESDMSELHKSMCAQYLVTL